MGLGDGVGGRWQLVQRAFPGQVILLRAADGGYDAELGFADKATHAVTVVSDEARAPIPDDRELEGDPESEWRRWYSLREHSSDVAGEARALTTALSLVPEWVEAATTAGRWHDLGKAHPVWQEAARKLGENPPSEPIAKSQSSRGRIRYGRRGFRHELASALAALAHGQSNLVAYLVACHHGKVRLSLRAGPNEPPPERDGRTLPDVRFARGVWDGDRLPAVDLGDGVTVEETELSLAVMELGQDASGSESWATRVLALRDDPGLGPFRLGFLEAIIKCADERASRRVAGARS